MDLSEKIKKDYEKSGYSFRELEKITGIPSSSLQRYVAGDIDNIPISRLEILAKSLGASIKYWLGWETEENPKIELDNRTSELIQLFSQLTPEQQELIAAQIKGILSQKNNPQPK